MSNVVDLQGLVEQDLSITFDNLADKIKEYTQLYIIAAIKDLVEATLKEASISVRRDTGAHADSLGGSTVDVQTISNSEYVVLVNNLVDYSEYIEFGRLPGKAPPPGIILEWVRRNITTGPEARGIAFAIGQNIARNGIAGTHQLQQILDSLSASLNL
jgi:hypothetical protein